MTFLIIPGLLFLMVAPTPGPPAKVLGDFTRFSKAIHKQIAVIDVDGTEHAGVLTAATGDQVSVRIGTGEKTFSRAHIVSAERMRDGRIDGVIKGALFGFVMSAFASQGCDSTTRCHTGALIATTTGIGYLLDATQTHRQPLYRAAPPPIKVSLRF
jgi:hypothetical protein